MKQSLLTIAFGCLVLASASGVWADSTKDQLQAWIASHAVPVRSVDAADEDFSDLEPLAKAIGSAQVVELGEPGHGAGTSFAAKVRLVKFLHQKMGFDVLVWESGMYDVALSDAGMRGNDTAMVAARRGVFQLWSGAEEVRPLFDYIKASQTSAHPLAMAGFDMQVTADGTMEQFASDLRAFVQALKQTAFRDDMAALADQAVAARTRLFSSKFEAEADVTALDQAAEKLLKAMHDRRAAFQAVHDAKSIAWMEHWIENMRLDARQRYDARHASGPEVARENRRDARNFENLRWLIQQAHPGKKFIVWAHNVHVMKAGYSADFRTVHVEPQPDDMKTTGALLAQWLGGRVYAIGMTAYQGRDALVTGGPATVIDPAPADSLEGRLHSLGRSFVFLDLRAGHMPVAARMPKYDSGIVSDPGRVYDGIFYIDQMEAATKLH
jgi:erythromycin esterase